MDPRRRAARRTFDALLRSIAEPLDDSDLAGPALVLAPHPDDETLACGGVVCRMRDRGVPVTIAVLTDGRTSHRHLLPGEELARLRAREVVEAAKVLQVESADVVALGCRDGALAEEAPRAVARLREILLERRPATVFAPDPDEPQADHRATHAIALAALRQAGLPVTLLHYPVWNWSFWPYAPLSSVRCEGRAAAAWTSLWRAWAFLARFRRRIRLEPHERARKREALERHATQMSRLGRTDWTTLGDVWDGAFLDRFLGWEERFLRVDFAPGTPGARSIR